MNGSDDIEIQEGLQTPVEDRIEENLQVLEAKYPNLFMSVKQYRKLRGLK